MRADPFTLQIGRAAYIFIATRELVMIGTNTGTPGTDPHAAREAALSDLPKKCPALPCNSTHLRQASLRQLKLKSRHGFRCAPFLKMNLRSRVAGDVICLLHHGQR
jgi:hypothetical protein